MKHHHHAIGWRVANRHDIPMRQEWRAFILAFVIVVALTACVVATLAK